MLYICNHRSNIINNILYNTLILTIMASIYVGTYKKYAEGSLFGKWLDLDDYYDAEDFFEACAELHKDENDPEFMFQDYEGFPERFYSESMGIDELQEVYYFLNNFDDNEREAIEEYWDEVDSSASAEKIRDAIACRDMTGEDYAEEFITEIGYEIPSWLVGRIDWKGVWRDFEDDGYVETSNYIFHPLD